MNKIKKLATGEKKNQRLKPKHKQSKNKQKKVEKKIYVKLIFIINLNMVKGGGKILSHEWLNKEVKSHHMND